MSCNGCATTQEGLPRGCKNNGTCQTGTCNKLNTYNWLADIPIAFGSPENQFYEVSFKGGSRKGYYTNDKNIPVDTGDYVVVEAAIGYDVGEVTLSGELVRIQMKKKKVKEKPSELRSIKGIAGEEDIEKLKKARQKEHDIMVRARAIARTLNLDMKIGDVEFQGDGKKATFYYTADQRVDFRELIKEYAREFHVKVEMRQIGARQEAGRIGGIGDCGRELCCSTWLTNLRSVSTSAARYQNLSINVEKLSGQCGRLKCCLNYELDTYLEALNEFPKKADKIITEKGAAFLQKTDILKKLLWYSYEDSQKYYPISIEKVNEILEANAKGEKPADLNLLADYETKEEVEEQSDLVGHISLESLEKTSKRKRKKNKRRNNKHRRRRK